ncbi:TPA: hypothetical protein O4G09_004003 [Klebsiella michiganensis]|nr:hypothetical protein [Klebsiella michiganensis]
MFKTFDTGWLKRSLLQVLLSGWTVVVLLAISLLLCGFSGRPAFCVWWLAFSGVLLLGVSIWLGNLPYRWLQPARKRRKWMGVLSWMFWGLGFLSLVCANIAAKETFVIVFSPLAGLTAFLMCLWISRREPFKWTR